MARQKTIPRAGVRRFPDKPMSPHGLHSWWYRCLARAGIVPEGAQSGERMHKARHAAGQRVLDRTGNLKAVQKLLGHASIQTTGDVYADGDIDQLARTQFAANPRNRRATSGDGGNRTRVRSRAVGSVYERSRRSGLVPRSPRRRGSGEPAPCDVPGSARADLTG